MNTSPALNDKTRTPLEALRDLTDKAELLARHIKDGTDSIDIADAMDDFLDQLPLDALAEAESAQKRLNEEAETKAYHEDRRAMDRRPV